MDIRIKADFEMTPQISEYLASRIEALEKFLGNDAELARCEVELGKDAGGQRHGEHVWFAEITIISPGGVHARATNRAMSINAAIDDVKEEIERQLRKQKKLHMRIIRQGGAFAKRLLRFGQ